MYTHTRPRDSQVMVTIAAGNKDHTSAIKNILRATAITSQKIWRTSSGVWRRRNTTRAVWTEANWKRISKYKTRQQHVSVYISWPAMISQFGWIVLISFVQPSDMEPVQIEGGVVKLLRVTQFCSGIAGNEQEVCWVDCLNDTYFRGDEPASAPRACG